MSIGTYASWDEAGIDIKGRAYGNVKCHCPKCDREKRRGASDTPLSANISDGVWLCHRCGFAGKISGKHWASDLHTPKRDYVKPEVTPTKTILGAARSWLESRGIDPDLAADTGVYSSPDGNSLAFPYVRHGEVIHVKYRSVVDKRFWSTKDTELTLYGYDDAIGSETVAVCEGEMDRLAMVASGFDPVVSVPNGAPAPGAKVGAKLDFLDSCEEVFASAKQVIIATDNDEPGRTLANELVRRIGSERCYRVQWPDGCKDANDVLIQHGTRGVADLLDSARPEPISGIVTGDELTERLIDLYNNDTDTGIGFGYPHFDQIYRVKSGMLTIVTGHSSHGKALALDTRLPTPDGWTTMGDVQTGDHLLDETGKSCRVVASTEVMRDRPCYRVTFSDGTEVIADANHQWLTRDYRAFTSESHAKRNGRHERDEIQLRGMDQRHKRTYPQMRTTAEIAETLHAPGQPNRKNHAVRLAGSLQLPSRSLPVAPYTLGAWLGDGHSQGERITTADREIVDHIEVEGYTVRKHVTKYNWGIAGLARPLRALNLVHNKHIPTEYLRASESQRRLLLMGLMDTDGSVTNYGRVEYTSMSRRLARDVHELAASLGYRPRVIEGRATIDGRDCGEKYRVTFTPWGQVFGLTRKQVHIKLSPGPKSTHRYIVDCDPVESVPVRCVQVDSPSHLYLCTEAMIPTHNSTAFDQLLVRLVDRAGWHIAIFSPEQVPLEKHQAQIIEQYSGLPTRDGPARRKMSRDELLDAHAWVSKHFTYILPEQPTIDEIMEKAKVLIFRRGIQGLVIDPWNEIEHERPYGTNDTEYINQALQRLRTFARVNDVHLWLIAHPTKMPNTDSGEEQIPKLQNISGSVHFRNKADFGLTVFRDLATQPDEVDIIVTKSRWMDYAKPGRVRFAYDKVNKRLYEKGPVV